MNIINILARNKNRRNQEEDHIKEAKFKENENTSKRKQEQDENDSCYCKICQEDVKENMIKCSNCEVWVHELSAGTTKKTKCYYCDDCQDLTKTIRCINKN